MPNDASTSPSLARSARLFSGSAPERNLCFCGGTGVGKSEFIEHCLRQDILAGGVKIERPYGQNERNP